MNGHRGSYLQASYKCVDWLTPQKHWRGLNSLFCGCWNENAVVFGEKTESPSR